jgi:hypothetical protein
MREVFICSLYNDTAINSNYKASSYEEKSSKATQMIMNYVI